MLDAMEPWMPGSHVDILIVGTGFAGLGMAIKLREAGMNDFLLIEKGNDVGGTWRDNTYPGAACDIPSHLYSLSFEPKSDWSRMFPRQPELFTYLRDIAEKHDLRRQTRFNTALREAKWDEQRCLWLVTTDNGSTISARVLISGMGALHYPSIPHLPGIENFQGKAFHSANWDRDYDLRGKNIAVIGSGASAVQFVPQIAPDAAQLHLFQRTPSWIVPKLDRPFSEKEKSRFAKWPLYRAFFRRKLFWLHEIRVLAFLGNKRAQKAASHMAVSHLKRQIKDPVLRAKVTPDYVVGCKRVLISNDYFPALTRPNVAVVTEGVAEVRAHSIVDKAGIERPIDTIIYGTGFQVTDAMTRVRLTGRRGIDLNAHWAKTGMQAYKGINVSNFPNFFMLLGPNTGLGHNSVVIMIEAQIRYVMDCLTKMRAANVTAIDIPAKQEQKFVDDIQGKLAGTVWLKGGCKSWYLDENGRNSTIWPGSTISYRRATKQADLAAYELIRSNASTPAAG
jgi:cation diffusion facilitator CzcD-associated flavoprotein CzcO